MNRAFWVFFLMPFCLNAQLLRLGGKGGDEVYRLLGSGDKGWAIGSFQQNWDNLTARGFSDIFLINYQFIDNQFITNKKHSLGSSQNDLIFDAADNRKGEMLLAVGYHSQLWYDTELLSESRNPALALLCLDAQGRRLWSLAWGGKGKVEIADIQADAAGNWYATGYFQDTLPLGTRQLVCADGQNAVFVVKINAQGKLVWAAQSHWSSGRPLQGSALAVDELGEVYLAGHYAGRLAIVAGDTLYSNPIYSDIFLAKVSPKGQWRWAKRFGGVYADYARQLSLDGQRLYLGGELTGVLDLDTLRLMTAFRYPDVFVAELDTAGRALRAAQFLGNGDAALETLLVSDSLIRLGGYFRQDWQGMDSTHYAVGAADFFWLEWDKTRWQLRTLQTGGGKGNDLLRSMRLDAQGRLWLGGSFQQEWRGLRAEGFSDGWIESQVAGRKSQD